MSLGELRLRILGDALKCSFCGLCEWICPTNVTSRNNIIYGPRGRINIIIIGLREGYITDTTLESIYTCLVCMACNTQCPAGIDIAGDVRLFRYYLEANGYIK